jgi:hypothetical protein
MASGTPTAVAADAGALAELAGEAAVEVGERSAEAWTAAIETADQRREQLVAAGLRLAARHRWPEVAAAVRGVLAEASGETIRGLAPPGPR